MHSRFSWGTVRPASTFAGCGVFHMQQGRFWTNRGMEVPLYPMLICIAIAIRGGGAWSVDRLLKREI